MLSFVVGLLVLVTSVSQEQNSFSVRQFTTRDGLAHNTVLGSFVDSNGTIWLSTMDGISRYDANGFFTYRAKDFPELATNFIHSVDELGKDTLLITTRDQGLALFFVKENRFKSLKLKAGEVAQNQYSMIRFATHLSKYEVLIGFSNDVWVSYNILSGQETSLKTNFTLTDADSYSVDYFKEKWFLKTDHFFGEIKIDLVKKEVNIIKEYNSQILPKIRLKSVFEWENSFVAYVENVGLVKLNADLSKIEQVLISNKDVKDSPKRIHHQDNIVYLLFNNSGFVRYDLESNQLETFDINQLSGINLQYVNAISHDRFGNMWAATWGTGLVQIQPLKGIHSVPKAAEFRKNYPDFNLGILEDKYETVWMLSAPGLVRWNRETNKINYLEPKSKASGWQLREDEFGLWMATQSSGIIFLPSQNYSESKVINQFQQFDNQTKGLESNNITMSLRDSHGRLWISHHNKGIEVFSSEKEFLEQNHPKRIAFFTENQKSNQLLLPDKSARILFESRNGSVWAGTFSGGIVRLSNSDGNFKTWIPDSSDGLLYPHKDIRGFYEDTKQNSVFWIATYGGGIIRWNQQTKSTQIINNKVGLSNNFTYGILDDEDGNLWIPTNNGLNRLNPRTNEIQVFTDVDGLNNNEFNTGGLHKGKSGFLYVGGVEGVNYFHPKELNTKKPLSDVQITSVKAYNRELFNTEFWKKSAKLDFEDHYLTFTYSGLDLTEPQKQIYKYRLVGSDSTWIQAGNRTSVSYSNLAPDNYTFEVMATNSDGIWNPKTDTFPFEIIPPFWMTWWFRLSAFLMLTALFIWVIRYVSTQKLKMMLQRLETEQKVQHERERISRDLHDHVGNQLANILSGVDLMRKYAVHGNQSRSDELHVNVKDDLRNTMQQLRETIWTLNKSEISLRDFVSRLETYFRTRITDTLSISVEIDETMKNSVVVFQPGKSLNVFRIIQEAVQNSLKYSGASAILVRFSQKANGILITVQDNGSFLLRDDGYEGYGLKNMQQRAKEIGANCSIFGDENGTKVELIIL